MKITVALLSSTAQAFDRDAYLKSKSENVNLDDERILPQNFKQQCSSIQRLNRKDRVFEASGQGEMQGTLRLENYPNKIRCHEEIRASSNCVAIKATVRSAAIESGGWCFDGFWLSWESIGSPSKQYVTPKNCHCYSEGCNTELYSHEFGYMNFIEHWDPSLFNSSTETAIRENFSINTNVFKFLFKSDMIMYGGHVVIDWECVEDEVSTQQPETTSAAVWSTTSVVGTTLTPPQRTEEPEETTEYQTVYPKTHYYSAPYYSTRYYSTPYYYPTTPGYTTPGYTTPGYTTPDYETVTSGYEICYEHDGESAFGNFVDAVRAGISKGLHNDVESYTRRPGQVTKGVVMRRDQWTHWFTKLFNKWVSDHQKSVRSGRRTCLVDNFSPGTTDGQITKECARRLNVNQLLT